MNQISSKIFIDGGEPEETRQANEIILQKLGRPLDGQTTNPTLIAKNLKKSRIKNLELRISEEEALGEYKKIVQEISNIIPNGSISIQVFANKDTKAEEMLEQARDRVKWIPNCSIKFPCTIEGLKAANHACRFVPINITLVFSQSQAAAVFEASKNNKFPVFISPFVGRLDDKGENGMDVTKNILKMYENSDHHVEVLTASVRNIEHILYAIQLQSEIITIPFKVFKLWADQNFPMPENNFIYPSTNSGLKVIPYREDVVLGKNFLDYDLSHELSEKGVDTFYNDWTNLFK